MVTNQKCFGPQSVSIDCGLLSRAEEVGGFGCSATRVCYVPEPTEPSDCNEHLCMNGF